ncbi:MAG: glycosyltransferase [Chitinivibrionales bacterium]|nr:glycosyltransferase [Chitinivibrionales bacterium]MBD3355850.1 glycosyltransferase [Chitinivibrionales bacterium]
MTDLKNIAVIGTYLPRMCGIATFTTDLVNALSSISGDANCWAMAMNDRPEGYAYPDKVRFELSQNQVGEYRRASDFLNISLVDVVCLQHEYGIYGGATGRHIIQLLRGLRMPVVTTLHTVLKDPSAEQHEVLGEIVSLSDRVVVMARRAVDFLRDIYKVPPAKIALIHHGIPDMPFVDPSYYKDQFGVEGRRVVLTFGLLSPNKGIEFMIQALPAIVAKHPDVVYMVVGTTHPHVKKSQGEEYRLYLQRMARKLGVDSHLVFHNRFVDFKELCEFLGSADIYVTPYLNESQIVSGTLAYAMGVGKATVSTPYWYAEEMMGKDRGILVPFQDAGAVAEAVIRLLDNETERSAIRKRAYTYSRNAVWTQVARDYMTVFFEVGAERHRRPRPPFKTKTLREEKTSLPEFKLDHLLALTDDTGIFQHAKYSVPDYNHGYCVDDNARALIVSVTAESVMGEEPVLLQLQKRYLAFLGYAFNEDNNHFRNFMAYDRTMHEERGSQDSCARALWGLGVCSAFSRDPGCVALATTLFHRGLQVVEHFTYPISLAFSLVGIHAYLSKFSGDTEVRRIRAQLAELLYGKVVAYAKPDWPWFQDCVTYASGRIPQALLLSGQWMQRGDLVEMGLRILDWLLEQQTIDDHFSPIGNTGWFVRGGGKARFDQQPIEAQVMLDACLLAHQMTDKEHYANAARHVFHWFLGQNDLNQPLYDYTTGGCRDGLQPNGPNQNQGAESTLAWLLSLIAMQGFESGQKKLQYVE